MMAKSQSVRITECAPLWYAEIMVTLSLCRTTTRCQTVAAFPSGNIPRLIHADMWDVVEIRISRCDVYQFHLAHACHRDGIVGHQPFLHPYGFAGSYNS